MNTFKGPFRLLLKEMRPTFYINTLVTLVLMAFFIILGFWTESADNSTVAVGVIFGPYYAIFLAYPFIIFPGYRYILSLGGTRKQFMKAALMSAVLYVLLAMLILNGLHFLSESIVSFGNHSISFFHMADLVNGENPLLYLWVDILWCLFLFGVGMIAKSIWFNFGPLRTLMAVTGLLILGIAAVTFLDLSQ
ncbi:hypothetical protein [Salibacterium aidingense]|uniref:hypothetical protein n=1 Tax=Salibacterium aidingense TaxID=384933 RepID=UPI000419D933|nr:hypothetical protein [Salibacterium aidingense]